ncbi:MAG: zinc ABC transporter substrate-binding protein [Bifidobacteriaceae bacterium]|jgi:zinc/manganese transport system substrate-binding protein|nr:zinc ABC transporter substrate-binding protein [Bifidobacteriaceae bacterium]
MSLRSLVTGATLLAVAAALAACAGGTGGAGGGASGGGSGAASGIAIVASTNVYGDVAQAVAGDLASVTSLITSAAQDPHEYEASAQDRLALDQADLVIKNGGGYDPFIDALLAAGNDAVMVDAVAICALEQGEDLNEHIWYDFGSVEKVAAALSEQLGQLDPTNAAAYQANYEAFAQQIAGLEASVAELRLSAAGRGVAITEPVPVYLLDAIGLVNQTPAEFSEAVEEGGDVPPRVLLATLELFEAEDLALLAYNAQTANATTEQVRAAAAAAGVPVVDFAETLPEGLTYIAWQQANLDHLAAALGQAGGD